MNEVIYHYCNVDTFNAIIANKCIRLSDLNKTNDYMEKKWIINLIEDSLTKEFKELDINMQLREDYWYDDGIENHISYLRDSMNYFLHMPTYIACFSKHRDRLSQWRAYGNDGTGIAVGFNYKKLKELGNINKQLSIKEVIYKTGKQLDAIQSAATNTVCYMLDMFETDAAKKTNDFDKYFVEEFDAFCEVICDYLSPLSCYLKNPAFSEEGEVRIFYSPNLYEGMDEEDIAENFKNIKKINGYILKPIEYQHRNNQLVGYADLNFESYISEKIITEIIIGPSSKVTKQDIIYLLLSKGYDPHEVIITQSEATYR